MVEVELFFSRKEAEGEFTELEVEKADLWPVAVYNVRHGSRSECPNSLCVSSDADSEFPSFLI